MKKCPTCGREYTDEVVRCVADNEILTSEEAAALPPPLVLEKAPIFPLPAVMWSDQRMRIFEVVLVCMVAFGGSILTSTYSFFTNNYGSSGRSALAWTVQSFREVSALVLVWYVLTRQKRSFSDLGLKWMWSDVGWSIILKLGELFAFRAVFQAIIFFGLTATGQGAAGAHVGNILFGGSVPVAAMLFQFLNPFFEELIVRAYLMTEIKLLTNSASMAILVSTVLQTSYHFYQGAPSAFAHGAAFLIFSIYYAKTNRIAPVILAHLYTDVGSTLWYWVHQ